MFPRKLVIIFISFTEGKEVYVGVYGRVLFRGYGMDTSRLNPKINLSGVSLTSRLNPKVSLSWRPASGQDLIRPHCHYPG